MKRPLAPLLSLLLILVACSSESSGPGSGGRVDPGQAVTVEEALALAEGAVLVRGYVFEVGGVAEVCDAIAESFPPQCGGARLPVEGLDLASLGQVEEAQGVRWTAQPALVSGNLANGVLQVPTGSTP